MRGAFEVVRSGFVIYRGKRSEAQAVAARAGGKVREKRKPDPGLLRLVFENLMR